MQIRIFGKNGCAKCISTKNKFNFFISKYNLTEKIKLIFHDLETLEGMTEGAYHNVYKIPTTILEKDGQVLARWEGEIPRSQHFIPYLKKNIR